MGQKLGSAGDCFYPYKVIIKAKYLSAHTCDQVSYRGNNIPHEIKWTVRDRGPPYNPSTGSCRLCLLEKYHIMFEPEKATLNQRSEFFSHCWHKAPQLLVNQKWSKISYSKFILVTFLFIHFTFPFSNIYLFVFHVISIVLYSTEEWLM